MQDLRFSEPERIRWAELSSGEKARLIRERVMADPDDPDLAATAHAVRAYLGRRRGYVLAIASDEPPHEVEFGIEGVGPAGYGKADDLADAICIAALRAVGVTVQSDARPSRA